MKTKNGFYVYIKCPCRALEGNMWAMQARAGKPKP